MSNSNAMKIQRLIHFYTLCMAVGIIMSKWLLGAIIGKVIEEATGQAFVLGNNSLLHQIVFLRNLSFTQVNIMMATLLALVSYCHSQMQSLSSVYSSMVGKELTEKILNFFVDGNSLHTITDTSIVASDTVRKIQIIESFKSDHEHQILFGKHDSFFFLKVHLIF